MVVTPNFAHELALFSKGCRLVAGIDEVGRGALAGPVMVGVVVVSSETVALDGLRDSKLLRPRAREVLALAIAEWAIDSATGEASAEEIDAVGIIPALRLAAQRAMAKIEYQVDAILLDGNFNWIRDDQLPPVTTVVKGDLKCASIAAASVHAKVQRDALMTSLAIQHPLYGWEANKGYGTIAHRNAIRLHGATALHRRTWKL